eukprot:609337-Rhodomonas_salina.2
MEGGGNRIESKGRVKSVWGCACAGTCAGKGRHRQRRATRKNQDDTVPAESRFDHPRPPPAPPPAPPTFEMPRQFSPPPRICLSRSPWAIFCSKEFAEGTGYSGAGSWARRRNKWRLRNGRGNALYFFDGKIKLIKQKVKEIVPRNC